MLKSEFKADLEFEKWSKKQIIFWLKNKTKPWKSYSTESSITDANEKFLWALCPDVLPKYYHLISIKVRILVLQRNTAQDCNIYYLITDFFCAPDKFILVNCSGNYVKESFFAAVDIYAWMNRKRNASIKTLEKIHVGRWSLGKFVGSFCNREYFYAMFLSEDSRSRVPKI